MFDRTLNQEWFRLASRRFLKDCCFTSIDPEIKTMLKEKHEDSNGETKVLKAVKMIQKSNKLNRRFLEGKFYFVGIIKYRDINNCQTFRRRFNIRLFEDGEVLTTEILMTPLIMQDMQETENNIDTFPRERILTKIAHEFKTPLICIASLSEQLNMDLNHSYQDSDLQKLKVYHSQICDLSNYTLYLINDITCYLKPQEKNEGARPDGLPKTKLNICNIRISLELFEVNNILKFCFKILKTLLTLNKDKAELVIPSIKLCNDVRVNSDPDRLKQIILNLVSNSVKFTRKGSIVIRSQICNDDQVLRISVEDTGIGIKNDDKNLVFREGNMFENHMCMNRMGSGLGLSIAHEIASTLNMELTFQSELEKGSIFVLDIPICKSNIIPAKKTTCSQSSSHSVSQLNSKSSIFNDLRIQIKSEEFKARSYKSSCHLKYVVANENPGESDDNVSRQTVEVEFTFDVDSFQQLNNRLLNKGSCKYSSNLIYSPKHVEKKSKFFTRKKILIVDDNNLILDSVEHCMRRLMIKHDKDYEIIRAADGIDLLKLVIDDEIENKIICIFTDENMEYINGSQALSLLRNLESQRKIRKRVYISMSAVEDLVNCVLSDYLLSKPVKIEDLQKILKRFDII